MFKQVVHTTNSVLYNVKIVRYMSIARQRVAKHIPTEINVWNNRTSIARQGT
jgi:hypothetical protein